MPQRKLVEKRVPAGKNALHYWPNAKNPLVVAYNFFLIYASRLAPSLFLKKFLLRLTGMAVEKNVSISQMANFDFFFPEKIVLKENCMIGFGATILSHEFLQKSFRVGETVIGKNVLVGANSTVLAGVAVGDNSVVSAMTLVDESVPQNSFVQGVPCKIRKKK